MRTMLNPGSQLKNPATYYVQWNGKAEKIKNSSGEIEKEGGYLFWKDRENEYAPVQISFPFVCYPLGESMSITGGVYDAKTNSGTFLSSTEFGDWNEPIAVYERENGADSGHAIANGTWNDIKDDVKAAGGKIQTNLYVLAKMNDEDEPCIVRLQLKGGSSYALSAHRKSRGPKFYEEKLKITGAAYRVNGGVDYAVPVFESGDAYSEETIQSLQPFAKEINAYGQALAQRNSERANKVLDDNGTVPADDGTDIADVEAMLENSEEVNFNDIPF